MYRAIIFLGIRSSPQMTMVKAIFPSSSPAISEWQRVMPPPVLTLFCLEKGAQRKCEQDVFWWGLGPSQVVYFLWVNPWSVRSLIHFSLFPLPRSSRGQRGLLWAGELIPCLKGQSLCVSCHALQSRHTPSCRCQTAHLALPFGSWASSPRPGDLFFLPAASATF